MILPPLVFHAFLGLALDCSAYSTTAAVQYKNKVQKFLAKNVNKKKIVPFTDFQPNLTNIAE
jgi:hypothetical protein